MKFQERSVVRIREGSLLARLAAWKLGTQSVAMVIGHTIHLYGATREEFLQRTTWVCHELRHVAQYEQYGPLGFLSRYLLESLRKGYVKNRFEVEARASEADADLMNRFTIEPPRQAR